MSEDIIFGILLGVGVFGMIISSIGMLKSYIKIKIYESQLYMLDMFEKILLKEEHEEKKGRQRK